MTFTSFLPNVMSLKDICSYGSPNRWIVMIILGKLVELFSVAYLAVSIPEMSFSLTGCYLNLERSLCHGWRRDGFMPFLGAGMQSVLNRVSQNLNSVSISALITVMPSAHRKPLHYANHRFYFPVKSVIRVQIQVNALGKDMTSLSLQMWLK